MPDSSGAERLSEGERACLRLLAQGHDTKSLAAALGISHAAATERLRAARAKLGTTSSREAARLLAEVEARSQDTGATFSGLAAPAAASHAAPAGRSWFARKGVIAAMLIAVLALAAALTLSRSEPPPREPRLVATLPANGSTIAPGPFTLSVTYDQPMAPGSWSFVRTGRAAFPDCDNRPVQSADGRTFSMRCTARAGTAYEVAFNAGRFRNFRAVSGVAALSGVISFRAR